MNTDEEQDLHKLLSGVHMQKLLSVHDIVRSRSYETPVPQFDPTWHPQTNYDRHKGRGKGKGPEYRTVGLHKSANEPLVSVYTNTFVVQYTDMYMITQTLRKRERRQSNTTQHNTTQHKT